MTRGQELFELYQANMVLAAAELEAEKALEKLKTAKKDYEATMDAVHPAKQFLRTALLNENREKREEFKRFARSNDQS